MSFSETFKIRGDVLEKNRVEASLNIIQEALRNGSLVGEIRTGNNLEILSAGAKLKRLLSVEEPSFVVDDVEKINNQLEFSVRFFIDISQEAVDQLTMVPLYLVNEAGDPSDFILVYARPDF